MKRSTLTAVVWKEGGNYVSLCPQMDVSSFGSTKKEAVDNLKEAVTLYIEAANKLKIKLPSATTYQKLVLPLNLAH